MGNRVLERGLGGDEFRNFKICFSVFDPAGVDVIAIADFLGQDDSIIVIRNDVSVPLQVRGKYDYKKVFQSNLFSDVIGFKVIERKTALIF